MRFIHRPNSAGANKGEIALHLLSDSRAVVQNRYGSSREFDTHEAALESAVREAKRYPEKDDDDVYVILHDGTVWPEHWVYQLDD